MASPFDDPAPSSSGDAPAGESPAPEKASPKKQPTKLPTWLIIVGGLAVLAMVFVLTSVFGGGSDAKQQTTGGGAQGIQITQGQGGELEKVMDLMRQTRGDVDKVNQAVERGFSEVRLNQATYDQRLKRVEQVSGDVIARGISVERTGTDAASLGDSIRNLHPEAVTILKRVLAEQGLFGFEKCRAFLDELARSNNVTASNTDIKNLYEASAVTREDLTDELVDAVPMLVRKRLAMRIPRDDMSGIVKLVWSERETLPAITPGQMVSLATLVGRSTATPVTSTSPTLVADGNQVVTTSAPAPTRFGYVAVLGSDLPLIFAGAAPYLTGGPAVSREKPDFAAYLAARSLPMTRAFASRGTSTLQTLKSLAAEEQARFDRLRQSIKTPTVALPNVAEDRRNFAGQVLTGLALARAVREGVQDSKRIGTWAQDEASVLPEGALGVMDLRYTQSAYGVLLARDAAVPVLSPLVVDAMDAQLGRSIESAKGLVPPARMTNFEQMAAIQAVASAIVAARTGSNPTVQSVSQAVDDAVRLTALAVLAGEQVRVRIDELIPEAAGLFETGSRRDWVSMKGRAEDHANAALDVSLATLDLKTIKNNETILADRLAKTATLAAETMLVQTAALDAVNGDLDRVAGQSPISLFTQAKEYAQRRVERQIVPPMPRDGVIRQAYAISRDALAIALGRRRPPTTMGDRRGAANLSVPAVPAGAPATPEVIRTIGGGANDEPSIRRLVIPAGSYGEARVFSGVVCELGKADKRRMLINLDYEWRGPAGTTLRMKDLRLIAECTAMGGPARVNADIVKVSYRLPDGRQESVKADGWVVDDVIGSTGVIGRWSMPNEEIIPSIFWVSLSEMMANAFKPNQTVTTVNVSTTQVANEAQTPGQKAMGAGLETAAQFIADFARRVLSNLNPSIEVPNNQPVSVILAEDVVINIPIDQWDELEKSAADQFVADGFIP